MNQSDLFFLIQGDQKNEWWLPKEEQKRVITPLYEQWVNELGQGGMAYPGTEVTVEKKMGDYLYLIHIAGMASFMQNMTHENHRKRRICFLPPHDGSEICKNINLLSV